MPMRLIRFYAGSLAVACGACLVAATAIYDDGWSPDCDVRASLDSIIDRYVVTAHAVARGEPGAEVARDGLAREYDIAVVRYGLQRVLSVGRPGRLWASKDVADKLEDDAWMFGASGRK